LVPDKQWGNLKVPRYSFQRAVGVISYDVERLPDPIGRREQFGGKRARHSLIVSPCGGQDETASLRVCQRPAQGPMALR
jgi:hypothetical protein